MVRISFLLVIVFLTACSVLPRDASQSSNSFKEHNFTLKPPVAEINIDEPELEKVSKSSAYGEIPLVRNKQVDKWLNYYQGRGRKHMLRYLQRSTRYIKLMKEVLNEEGLPEDLVYLPIIESGFSHKAHSFAGAVGYWQFIRGTAKRYGLKINHLVDERRDPVLSTRAAANYFKTLYSLFGDWHLALASYNTGENRVKRVVMKYTTRDFWTLAKNKKLPRETREYVPKFLAAIAIAKKPYEYGFLEVEYKPQLVYDKLFVSKPISLYRLSKEINVSFKELKKMNPRYLTDYVPIYRSKSSLVRVPKGLLLLARSAEKRSRVSKPTRYEYLFTYYKVRRGDTLSQIARRHGVKISDLRRRNNFSQKQSFLRVGQKLRIPQRPYASRKITSRKTSRKVTPRKKSRKNVSHYKVRRGDTLFQIARRHGVKISDLRRRNNFSQKQSFLRVGQKLRISERPSVSRKVTPRKTSRKVTPRKKSRKNVSYYKVRRGDTLFKIARRHGVKISDLRRRNNFSQKQSFLRVGQKLRISERPSVSRKVTSRKKSGKNVSHYKVRRGDTLFQIARRHGMKISDLRRRNNLSQKQSFLMVGQKLRISERPSISRKVTSRKTSRKNASRKSLSKKIGQRFTVYTVKKGDTLWDISRMFQVSVKDITMANAMRDRSRLSIGHRVKIPVNH